MAKAASPPPPPTDPVELLSTPLARSGFTAAATLRRAGIRLGFYDVRDLLFHLPRRYDDLREMRKLGDLLFVADGDVISAQATVGDVRVEPGFRGRTQRTIARLEDDTGSIDATWFGRRFIERRLAVGSQVVVSGKIKHFGRRLTLDNPEFQVLAGEMGETELLHAGRIVPVYPLTAGLTAIRLRAAIREALDKAGYAYPEYLPDAIARAEDLVPIARAIEEAHYPASFPGRDAALRRLAFDELLALQLGMVERRRQRVRDAAPEIPVPPADDATVRSAIVGAIGARVGEAVELTVDQVVAMDALRDDLARPTPMLRLLQGDVGSGKTAVAAYALAATARAGLQGALLAPTDLLARQHLETVSALLEGVGIGVTLLTGSLKADVKARSLEAIASGQALVVVGTHALLQDAVSFADLGLVVIDEQHRFGVDQRGALEAKAGGRSPHVLLMTATPIPRTLGQVLYADLDVSDLRTPPAGRVKIRTGVKRPGDLDGTWQKVREEAALGHRTFVVVPLIEEGADDGDGAVAAESEAVRLAGLLAPLRVGMVHGRLKPAERDAEMTRFRDGDLDVLVGTTVVEVGRRRAGGHDDGHRRRRSVRARPAPPAPRAGRARQRRIVLRPGDRVQRRDGDGASAGGRRVERWLRPRREGLRAAQGRRCPRPRPERFPAASDRLAAGRRASRPGGPGTPACRGPARRCRAPRPAPHRPRRGTGEWLAPAGRGRGTGERRMTERRGALRRWLTPDASSRARPVASAWRRRGRGPGRSATA